MLSQVQDFIGIGISVRAALSFVLKLIEQIQSHPERRIKRETLTILNERRRLRNDAIRLENREHELKLEAMETHNRRQQLEIEAHEFQLLIEPPALRKNRA